MNNDREVLKLALADFKLIAAQDQGCGGNVTEAEAWRSAQSVAYKAIANISSYINAAEKQEPKKFDPNDSFERDEAARAIVREFMRNH